MGKYDILFQDTAPQPKAESKYSILFEQPAREQSTISEMFNTGKEGFKKSGEALGSTDMSAPSRVLQGVGNVAAIPFEAGTVAVERGLNELGILPALAKTNKAVYDKAMPEIGKKGIARLLDIIGGKVAEHPEAAGNVKAVADIAGSIPIAGEVAQPLGRLLESAGKTVLKGQMKIEKPLAKRVAGKMDLVAGKNKIVDDITKNNIESVRGFNKMVKNTEAKLKEENNLAEKAFSQAVKDNPNVTISADQITAKFSEDLAAGNVKGITYDMVDRANTIKEELLDKLKAKLGKPVNDAADLTLEEANRARKMLSEKAFKKGAAGISDDPIRDQVKENLALRFRDAVGEYAPKQVEHNRNIRDLINVKQALDAAQGRVTNWGTPTASDFWIGAPGFSAAAYAKSPEAVAAIAAILGAKRLATAGRAGAGIVEAGKAAQKVPNIQDLIELLSKTK